MLYTYNAADFDELLVDLQSELDRLRAEYNPREKPRRDAVHDYNRLVSARLILQEVTRD